MTSETGGERCEPHAARNKEGWREWKAFSLQEWGGLFWRSYSDPCWANFPLCPPDALFTLSHPALCQGGSLPGPHPQMLTHSKGRRACWETLLLFLFFESESCSLSSLFQTRDVGTLLLLSLGYCISFSSFLQMTHTSVNNPSITVFSK